VPNGMSNRKTIVRTLSCQSQQLKTKPIADSCLGFARPQQGVDRLEPVPAFEKGLSEEPMIDGADKARVPGSDSSHAGRSQAH
jgi:hypothetical protein